MASNGDVEPLSIDVRADHVGPVSNRSIDGFKTRPKLF